MDCTVGDAALNYVSTLKDRMFLLILQEIGDLFASRSGEGLVTHQRGED
jgi:hypothetical protein